MKIIFDNKETVVPVSDQLKSILNKIIKESWVKTSENQSLTFNFKDNSYDPETGGYHPVEIRLIKGKHGWRFDYITDFAYVGIGYMAELTKEIDFDFSNDVGYHLYTGEVPLNQLTDLYELWESNFISYVEMDVFTVKIQSN